MTTDSTFVVRISEATSERLLDVISDAVVWARRELRVTRRPLGEAAYTAALGRLADAIAIAPGIPVRVPRSDWMARLLRNLDLPADQVAAVEGLARAFDVGGVVTVEIEVAATR